MAFPEEVGDVLVADMLIQVKITIALSTIYAEIGFESEENTKLPRSRNYTNPHQVTIKKQLVIFPEV